MAYVAQNPASYLGKVVGTGHCVPYVQAAASAPVTKMWRRGAKVRGNIALKSGTAIATFDPAGTYGSHTDGRSHAAIYESQDAGGINVIDQWIGQPVHRRKIRFKNGAGKAVDDGDQYYVVD